MITIPNYNVDSNGTVDQDNRVKKIFMVSRNFHFYIACLMSTAVILLIYTTTYTTGIITGIRD